MPFDNLDDRITNDPQMMRAVLELREWFRAWHTAWEAAAEVGACDALGSVEYARMTAAARFERVEASQTAMRRFIRERADVPSPRSITEASLARREALAKERSERHED